MQWIHKYQLFLFDFDGLLVNTEDLHFQAYKSMCSQRGFHLDWNFKTYCHIAHHDADTFRHKLYDHLPQLYVTEPNWNILYEEKTQAYISLIEKGAVQLMPGVELLLSLLHQANIKRCVVTHSKSKLVNTIKKQHPILSTIDHWFTREDYTHPKPNPECYLNAIEKLGKKEDKIIGFEDTPRGLKALMETKATPIWISSIMYENTPDFLKYGVVRFPSFLDIKDGRLD